MKIVWSFASAIFLVIPLAFAPPLFAQSPDAGSPSQADQIKALEQKVEQLDQAMKVADRKAELKSDDEAAKAKSGAHVTVDDTGFTIISNDENSSIKIGGDLQIDNRAFYGPALTTLPDTILLRRARPTLSGTVFKNVDYFFRPDFGQGTVVIYDAYVQLNYFSRFRLRVGKFKPGVGLERLQSDDDTSFVERGLPTLLVPSRDIGFQLGGDIIKQRLNYSVGLYNGVPDNGLSDAAVSDHRDLAARVFLTPFLPDNNALRGLGLGIGASSGSVDGIALPSYKTFGQNSFISFASGVTSDGHRSRLAPGGYYYLGAFGLFSEYGVTQEGFQKGTARHAIALRAWQVAASYVLTGERKGFTGVAPRKNFDPKNHTWGAVEVAVRVGDFSTDKGLYNYGFASATNSARRAHEWVGGVGWYLNRMTKVVEDFGYTTFEGGAANGNRPAEKALITRFQFNFLQ
jgi:phosphate-selective porin OprO/OprP